MAPSDFSRGTGLDFASTGLYHAFRGLWSHDPVRSPLLPLWISQHSAPPTPEGSSRLHVQNLHLFRDLRDRLRRSAPSCSPCGANISTLQDSLHGTDCWFALPSQEDTTLHHTQSPGCSGSLLRGSLAITTTGLAPDSHQDLSRHTKRGLDGTTT